MDMTGCIVQLQTRTTMAQLSLVRPWAPQTTKTYMRRQALPPFSDENFENDFTACSAECGYCGRCWESGRSGIAAFQSREQLGASISSLAKIQGYKCVGRYMLSSSVACSM